MAPLARITFAAFALVLSSLPAAALDAARWSQFSRSTGTVFFKCGGAVCGGPEALLSYHTQPVGRVATLDDWARGADERTARMKAMGLASKRVAATDMSANGLRHFRVVMSQASPLTGSEWLVTGYVERAGSAYSLVSTAPARKAAEANYRELVDHVRKM